MVNCRVCRTHNRYVNRPQCVGESGAMSQILPILQRTAQLVSRSWGKWERIRTLNNFWASTHSRKYPLRRMPFRWHSLTQRVRLDPLIKASNHQWWSHCTCFRDGSIERDFRRGWFQSMTETAGLPVASRTCINSMGAHSLSFILRIRWNFRCNALFGDSFNKNSEWILSSFISNEISRKWNTKHKFCLKKAETEAVGSVYCCRRDLTNSRWDVSIFMKSLWTPSRKSFCDNDILDDFAEVRKQNKSISRSSSISTHG